MVPTDGSCPIADEAKNETEKIVNRIKKNGVRRMVFITPPCQPMFNIIEINFYGIFMTVINN